MKKVKNRKIIFWCSIIGLGIIKQILVGALPLQAYADQGADDMLMIRLTDSIMDGNWLGEYNEMTLVKGCFFPLYLACINGVGLSFMSVSSLLYTVSCIIFCMGIWPLFKRKALVLVLYTILLFNPVSAAAWTFQRVYRNGLTLSQVLLIFGAIFAIYLRRNREYKVLIPWAVLSGVTLIMLWHTREDGIWILPFVIVSTVVLIVLAYIQLKETKKKRVFVYRAIIYSLPLFFLFIGNYVIRTVNYMAYGVFSYNEINDGDFADAIKSIYSVKNNDIVPYVSVTREKIKRLYEISPTLNRIRPELETAMNEWDYNDRTRGDGEVEDGWFFWCFREAVKTAGYANNAQEAASFYADVSKEIEEAFDKENSKIVRQNVMPSAIMSPWRKTYLEELPVTMAKATAYLIMFDDVEAKNDPGGQTEDNGIRLFESITNDMTIYPDDSRISLRGWFVLRDTNEYKLALVDENNQIIQKIEMLESEDVYENLCEEGIDLEAAHKCRFSVMMQNIGEAKNIYLASISNEGNIIHKIPLDNSAMKGETKDYVYFIDSLKKFVDFRSDYTEKYVERWNKIIAIYKKTNWIFFIVSCLLEVFIILGYIKKREMKDGECLLILGSILASLIVLIGGISYSEISAFESIRYMYLSGAYPLLLALEGITILYVFDKYLDEKGMKK